jgi:hypothetical protein
MINFRVLIPIILLDLQYPLEADSSEEGMQFAI